MAVWMGAAELERMDVVRHDWTMGMQSPRGVHRGS